MNPTNLKPARVLNDDPWAVLVALACLIIVATGISIIVICILWRKYRNSRVLFENNLAGVSYENPAMSTINLNEIPHIKPTKEYEVQSLDMYVPPDDRDDLGEVHVGFNPIDGIRHVHHVKEIQNPIKFNNCSDYLPQSSAALNLEDKLNLNESSLCRRVMHYNKFFNNLNYEQ